MTSTGDEDNWDFYEASTEQDGQRAVVRIDLNGRRHAAIRPTKLQVRFKMQRPRPDGLRDASEGEAVFTVEDRIADTLAAAADARHVATITADGYTELLLYLPSERSDSIAGLPSIVGPVSPYSPEWFVAEDADWGTYEELFPNRWAMQSIENRKVLRQLLEHGDQPEVAREIDHYARFPSPVQATAASATLNAAGFRCDSPVGHESGKVGLGFHRNDALAQGRIDEVVFEIMGILDSFEGDYDGWGSAIQKAT